MTKRLLSLVFVAIMLVMTVPAVMAEDDTPDPRAGYYYVYTEDGKSLNVREMPNGKVVGRIKYGTRIYVEGMQDNNWARISFRYNKAGAGVGEYACYVSRRFLTKTKPSGAPAGKDTSSQGSGLSGINAEFRTAQIVEVPFVVIARPSRASGWVNLRWAPTTEAERIATCGPGKELVVIAETKNWYQVRDDATGAVGFITKKYVTAK